MGWKGVVRSVGAAGRRMERNAKRRQRELALLSKKLEKLEAIQQAEHEVDVYNNQIDFLKSLHRDCSESLDWRNLAGLSEPLPPMRENKSETLARSRLAQYRPGFIDRIFKREERKRTRFSVAIEQAILKDEAAFQNALKTCELDKKEWAEMQALCKEILVESAKGRIRVLEESDSFEEVSDLGSHLSFCAEDGKPVRIKVKIRGEEVIPREVKVLLQSGKMSVKAMPKGQFYELHQDYVCGVALRIARETFALLPDEVVIVTAVDDLLDKSTGHVAELPILSVIFSRKTIEKLNFELIDPSECMKNFLHKMKFKKTTGFEVVEECVLPS